MIHPWQQAYKEKTFEINTLIPSIMVESNAYLFYKGDKVLDIGCGNGRNSIFLAHKQVTVDCFDVADLSWLQNVDNITRENINFFQTNINDWVWKDNYYKGVILARVIQYLPIAEVEVLFNHAYKSLLVGGIMLVSYSVSGGIHEREEIQVDKFSHHIQDIKKLLNHKFKEVIIKDGSNVNIHVNYDGNLKSFDIIAFK